ncbi:MAG: redoxin domain-containing protein, partial [Chloroflexi bacterium]|nr:redoxin domain-containing protein [Chloroflexota bacterium]
MNAALLAARLVLALVFLVAGLGKLADLPGSRKAVRDFGLPASLAGPIGVVLPLVELAIAVALIPTASAWAAAIAALALLALFILTISVNLARGRKPDCHCFGQVASGPIGWWTLVRNGVLAAIAIFIVAEGSKNAGTSAVEWTTKLNNPEKVGLVLAILAFALILAQWGFLLELLRQNGRLLERLESLERAVSAVGTQGSQAAPEPQPAAPPEPVFGRPVGSPAPGFVLSGLYGETMTLDALRAQGRPVLLVFTDPGCGPCGELLPEIGRWQQEYENRMVIAVISRGTPEANRAKMAEHGIRNVLLQQDDEVARSFQYPGTPSAVMVQAEGVIGTPVSAGPGGIRTLVASLMGAPSEAPAAPAPIPSPASPPLPLLDEMPTPAPAPNGGNGSAPSPAPVAARVGDPAPALALKDLDNHTVDLSQLRGEPTALIFWNLGCGFCQRMLPDLKEWEKNKPAEAPRVMVISSGSVEDNRAMGLRSTVLLDNNFQAGQSFGAQGTPMAVL